MWLFARDARNDMTMQGEDCAAGEHAVRPYAMRRGVARCAGVYYEGARTMRDRRTIRLRGHDYAGGGSYFVTICAQVRWPWFGEVRDGVVFLSDAGYMVDAQWRLLATRFSGISLDTFVVMPDHMHGIIHISAKDTAPSGDECLSGTAPGSLGRIVQVFKARTTNVYAEHVRDSVWPPFSGRLWQRNYYEHIVRGEGDLARIRAYILHNPLA